MSSIYGHLSKTQARLIVPIQRMSFLVHAWQSPFLEIFFWWWLPLLCMAQAPRQDRVASPSYQSSKGVDF